MSRFTALLACCLLLFTPALSLAQSAVVKNNNQPDTAGGNFYGVGYWTGTTWVPAQTDASGVMKMAEQYPPNYQKYNEVLFSSTVAASATENVAATVWSSAHLYTFKAFRLKLTSYATGAAGLNGGFVVRVKGSSDGVTYQTLTYLTPAGGAAPADTLRSDTLQVRAYNNSASPSANGTWHNLPVGLSWPYLQFAFINRGSATATVELEVMGRQ